jgi:hypothetical protein
MTLTGELYKGFIIDLRTFDVVYAAKTFNGKHGIVGATSIEQARRLIDQWHLNLHGEKHDGRKTFYGVD